MVENLINAGVDIHEVQSNGSTALNYAVKLGYLNSANILLNASADINQIDEIDSLLSGRVHPLKEMTVIVIFPSMTRTSRQQSISLEIRRVINTAQ
ncbi:MAG: hypothetical protein OXC62_06835 [Aestuariivita sp.]|nr:hypothetical protein [Aestuariivita sp.]